MPGLDHRQSFNREQFENYHTNCDILLTHLNQVVLLTGCRFHPAFGQMVFSLTETIRLQVRITRAWFQSRQAIALGCEVEQAGG